MDWLPSAWPLGTGPEQTPRSRSGDGLWGWSRGLTGSELGLAWVLA